MNDNIYFPQKMLLKFIPAFTHKYTCKENVKNKIKYGWNIKKSELIARKFVFCRL